MDEKRLYQLIQNYEPVKVLTVEEVQKLVHKAKPEWEKVLEQRNGAAGPAYATQVVLPTFLSEEITLDIVVAAYTEFMNNAAGEGSYQPRQWQLVIAEGDSIRANYKDDGEQSCPVKDLFERAQQLYEIGQLFKEQPSAKRTKAAVKKYLSE